MNKLTDYRILKLITEIKLNPCFENELFKSMAMYLGRFLSLSNNFKLPLQSDTQETF